MPRILDRGRARARGRLRSLLVKRHPGYRARGDTATPEGLRYLVEIDPALPTPDALIRTKMGGERKDLAAVSHQADERRIVALHSGWRL